MFSKIERAPSLDEVPAAVEVQLQAGDAACFVDCLAHGSARRVNPEQRRILIIRYGPHWGQRSVWFSAFVRAGFQINGGKTPDRATPPTP